jgi:hypothetical protein
LGRLIKGAKKKGATTVKIFFHSLKGGGEGAECELWAQAGATNDSSSFTSEMLETIMRDPSMQEMLYKYLPESMRNPETFEFMLNTPEYRKQLETLVQQQVMMGMGVMVGIMGMGVMLGIMGMGLMLGIMGMG